MKSIQVYTLRVQRGPLAANNWTLEKRYSDFATLDDKLKAFGYNLPLPPKKIVGNMSLEFIAERQKALQVFNLNLLVFSKFLIDNVLVLMEYDILWRAEIHG